MMEKIFEIKGYFWSPSNPKEELPGILKFNQDNGIDLELFGNFKTFISANSKENNIVLGFTSNGKKVTLINCYEYSRSFGFPGFPHSSISAIYLFIGEHFKSTEEVCFDQMKIIYEDINYWLDITGFENPKYDDDAKEIMVKYKRPDNLNYEINENWQMSIEFSVYSPIKYFVPVEKAEIKQIPEIFFKPKGRENFQKFYDHFQALNSFLSMCYFTYPKIESVEFFIEKKEINREEMEEKTSKIELYFKYGVDYSNYKTHDSRVDFLITYKDINALINSLIKKWFNLKEKIEASINILTESFMSRKSPIEFYFLGLAQALENMHRRITNEKIYFKNRIEAMIGSMPEKISKALVSNETNFSGRITENRNYFTHYDVKLEEKAAPLSELFVLAEKMRIVLIVNLMVQLGVDNIQIEKIIFDKSRFLFNHLIKGQKDD